MPATAVEAEGASGSDVDGRLSLSSANNIQHRSLRPLRRLRKPSSGRERPTVEVACVCARARGIHAGCTYYALV
jgi:hypothetical protein